MKQSRFALFVVAAVLVSHTAQAQKPTRKSNEPGPADVVRSFFDATAHERWVEAAGLIKLEKVERLRQSMLAELRHPSPPPKWTVEDFMRRDPSKPRAVAEYELSRLQQAQAEQPDVMRYEFANLGDSATLAQMPLLEAGARWLEAKDGRYEFRQAMRHAPRCVGESLPPPIGDSLNLAPQPRVLGAIQRGDTAYVLIRDPGMFGRGTTDADDIFGPRVVTVHRQKGRWYILPSERLMRGHYGMMAIGCDPTIENRGDSTSTKKKPPV
jgi:hypothetical protein